MTWAAWIAQVLANGSAKGLSVSVSYPGPGLATFTWRGYTRNGVAGAGASMIALTNPDEFTRHWYDLPIVQSPTLDGPADALSDTLLVDRRGRYVPRVPARATSNAIQELFK